MAPMRRRAGRCLVAVAAVGAAAWLSSDSSPAFSAGGLAVHTTSRSASLTGAARQKLQAVAPRLAEGEASEASTSIGGYKTETMTTGIVAGVSVFLLCALGEVTRAKFGLPMWGPPLGAVSLIFAGEAVGAAQKGQITSWSAIFKRCVATGCAVVGTTLFSVLITMALGPVPLARAASVGVASIFMTFFPQSGYFAPAGAFCALYVDQAIAKGALAELGLRYALFPCATGTIFLLLCTRAVAFLLAQPLRKIAA